jgi:molybdate transport system substrate-binding protein
MRICATAVALILLAAAGPSSSQSDKTLRVWTARALATVLAEAGSEFEQASGYRLALTSDLPTGFERRFAAGERVDLLITGSVVLDEWIGKGRIAAASRTDISRSAIGVGVRAGAAKPDISSTAAFRRALLDARSIAYLRVGSGLHVHNVIAQLGIADTLKSKVTRPETDIVSELVAKGEVELGIVVITQILTTPGVELAGPLPPELQSFHTFTAGVAANAGESEPARALIAFLKGPVARRVIERQGMQVVAGR